MPRSQVAVVQNYDFGAPEVSAEVLRFQVKQGGKQTLRFEPEGENDIVVTVQVSANGTSWANTSAAANGTAVVSESIQVGTQKEFVVAMRAGKDLYMRVNASGADRCAMQARGPSLGILVI